MEVCQQGTEKKREIKGQTTEPRVWKMVVNTEKLENNREDMLSGQCQRGQSIGVNKSSALGGRAKQ